MNELAQIKMETDIHRSHINQILAFNERLLTCMESVQQRVSTLEGASSLKPKTVSTFENNFEEKTGGAKTKPNLIRMK